ncbi:hypothetical protein [Maridesulfovibrio hydrothermalis]|uniref:Outer membrane protein beta-barrel domain-containing protein n=1 Tax=Maridesulfovibrio hydrothermalis AM13 = DSM 14728 TaxID=1121451 RepID=L0REN1_9BACT|nr:hypothetical protein [Maridesulfovibrio hydrothermalis]CCO24650.1 conserved exported protein of unknown function [Maridesulfovibrio hydrothermalis AM13 = DSM 14728]
MRKLLIILFVILYLPAVAFAWPGKIVAVENANTFVVLKEGQTPVKVELAGVKPSTDIDAAESKLNSSGIALMKEVEVRELGISDNKVLLGDITVDGKSLAKELLDEGVVQSSAPILEPAPQVADVDKILDQSEVVSQGSMPNEKPAPPTSNNILAELSPETETSQPPVIKTTPQETYAAQVKTPKTQVRYIRTYQQPQSLGLWPARTAPAATPASAAVRQPVEHSRQQSPAIMPRQTTEETPAIQSPGDISKKDYDLAVRVQRKTTRIKNSGFFVPKKKSETFIGASIGTQMSAKPTNTVPYSSLGAMGGASIRHFYPSGLGIGGDIFMSRTSGKSGTIDSSSNATNGTAYDYKSKSFDTYTFTGSLLYRFYTDTNITPYIAAHGGYSFFSSPSTEFNMSDGAPVAGGGAGLLYDFDSGFTIGADFRYLKTLGTKSHDPDGFFDSTLNFGYTFD